MRTNRRRSFSRTEALEVELAFLPRDTSPWNAVITGFPRLLVAVKGVTLRMCVHRVF